MSTTRRFVGKVLYVCTFFCIVFFFTDYANYAVVGEDRNCPKKKIQLHFWCEACKEIREFKDCDTADYIWDYKKYKAGSGGIYRRKGTPRSIRGMGMSEDYVQLH